jgi:hypothetical protein
MKYIVVSGNPIDGLAFHGPFENKGDAMVWADENVSIEYDWWLAVLNTVKDESEDPGPAPTNTYAYSGGSGYSYGYNPTWVTK